ncbi:6416_t:CDS:2, partial [Racocetra persica]
KGKQVIFNRFENDFFSFLNYELESLFPDVISSTFGPVFGADSFELPPGSSYYNIELLSGYSFVNIELPPGSTMPNSVNIELPPGSTMSNSVNIDRFELPPGSTISNSVNIDCSKLPPSSTLPGFVNIELLPCSIVPSSENIKLSSGSTMYSFVNAKLLSDSMIPGPVDVELQSGSIILGSVNSKLCNSTIFSLVEVELSPNLVKYKYNNLSPGSVESDLSGFRNFGVDNNLPSPINFEFENFEVDNNLPDPVIDTTQQPLTDLSSVCNITKVSNPKYHKPRGHPPKRLRSSIEEDKENIKQQSNREQRTCSYCSVK